MSENLLSVRDLCKILQVSKPKFYIMLAAGEFPNGIRFGRTPRWPSSAVANFLTTKYAEVNKPVETKKKGGK